MARIRNNTILLIVAALALSLSAKAQSSTQIEGASKEELILVAEFPEGNESVSEGAAISLRITLKNRGRKMFTVPLTCVSADHSIVVWDSNGEIFRTRDDKQLSAPQGPCRRKVLKFQPEKAHTVLLDVGPVGNLLKPGKYWLKVRRGARDLSNKWFVVESGPTYFTIVVNGSKQDYGASHRGSSKGKTLLKQGETHFFGKFRGTRPNIAITRLYTATSLSHTCVGQTRDKIGTGHE